jgi:hypothetical protein
MANHVEPLHNLKLGTSDTPMNVSGARLFALTLAHDSRRLAEHICERLQAHSGKSSRDEYDRVLAKPGGYFAV